jgi:hypothetical protein
MSSAKPLTVQFRNIAPSVLLLCALAACSGSSSDSSGTAGSAAHAATSGKSQASPPSAQAGRILESGFGQSGDFVWVTALVHNDSHAVGQTVTVHFDAMDTDGKLVKSTDQVEAFSRVGQDLAVGTQIDVPRRTKIGSVKAKLLIQDSGAFSDKPFPKIPVSKVKIVKTPYVDSYTAHFELTNPTSKPLQSPRIGIICHGAKDKVIGGGSAFPELVPPNDTTAVDATTVTSGKPKSCDVYVGAPM